jgi:hypothetical protein
VERELHPMIERWFGKLERHNMIIDKKFIHLDEELEKVVALVGEKIKVKFGEFSQQFMEAMEVEDVHKEAMEAKIVELEGKLETSHATNVLLAHLITSVQSRVGDLEDSDTEGEVVGSSDLSSSTDVEPVENMVAIPIPALLRSSFLLLSVLLLLLLMSRL